jgi:RNA polymerase sigma-70 factor (ECF subfamily)
MDPKKASRLEKVLAEYLGRGELHEAATEIIRGYGSQILGYLVTMLRDQDLAYDVFAEFSERLWTGLGGFAGQSSVKTWAYQVAWRCACQRLRDPYRRRGRPLESAVLSGLVDEVRSITPLYQQTEVKDGFARLRERLAPEEQTLLFLRINRRMPWSEIALVLAEGDARPTEAMLRKRFERLKAKLRELAIEEGIISS